MMDPSNDDNKEKANESVLDRKIRKLVDSQVENDNETKEALEELSTFFTENNLKNRRGLRGEIERRSLEINSEFVHEFQHVKDALDDVWRQAKEMNNACVEMQAQLRATKTRTRDLIEQTNAIQGQTRDVAKRSEMIGRFVSKYQLTEEQESLLSGATNRHITGDRRTVVDDTFFTALERAQEVHKECNNLLVGERLTKQTTAQEVVEQMSRLQESGLHQLFKWTQGAARSFSSCQFQESYKDPNGVDNLARAVKHLSARPALFNTVLEEYCASRRATLVRSFLEALTVGGPHGTPKPIELHAHDPLRYVGDMLAWLHQTTPTECDNLRSILKLVESVGSEGKTRQDVIDACLSDITEGVCRPLRSRVEQIMVSESTPVVLYKLSNLVRFYADTIKSVVPANSELIKTLTDLDEMGYKQFISVLTATVRQQTQTGGPSNLELAAATDLSASQSTMALLTLLKDTLASSSVMEEQKDQLEEIVNVVVNPLVSFVSETSSLLSSTDQDVYCLNSFYQIHLTLALFKFNDARLASLEREMELHLDTLSSEVTSNLIAKLDFQPITAILASAQQDSAQVLCEALSPDTLVKFLTKFDAFLVAPEVHFLQQVRMLVSSKHRKIVTRRSLEVVSASYKQLFQAVVDPQSGYVNPSPGIVNKTPEQIDLLLQL